MSGADGAGTSEPIQCRNYALESFMLVGPIYKNFRLVYEGCQDWHGIAFSNWSPFERRAILRSLMAYYEPHQFCLVSWNEVRGSNGGDQTTNVAFVEDVHGLRALTKEVCALPPRHTVLHHEGLESARERIEQLLDGYNFALHGRPDARVLSYQALPEEVELALRLAI